MGGADQFIDLSTNYNRIELVNQTSSEWRICIMEIKWIQFSNK